MYQSIKNIYHYFMALFAVVMYRYPARNLTVIGITGTDGKTTTANMVYHILQSSGRKVGLVSTVGAKIGNETIPLGLHVTTPSPFALQKLLRKMVTSGCQYAVVEATSHGLDQNRLTGCNFSIGVLTNITHEHLDYHRNFERYVKAKAKLFQGTKVAILNRDGPWYEAIKKCRIAGKIITVGLADDAVINPSAFPFSLSLPGDYNKQNALAAIAVAREIGIKDDTIRSAIASFQPVVGRLEQIDCGQPFDVYVDFAHTPNAVEQVLKTLRQSTKGRMIAVFGSAGERDQTKRPVTGQKAGENADIAILTADDPASEDVNMINAQIIPGLKNAGSHEINIDKLTAAELKDHLYVVIPDRRQAIEAAIRIAKPGDAVALLGKGHQKTLTVGKQELPWDEQAIVKDLLQQAGYQKTIDKKKYAAIVLAAGLGTRMKSDLPKVLHEIDGKPLLYYSLKTLESLKLGQIITVVKHQHQLVQKSVKTFSTTTFVIQGDLYGTAKSVQDALSALKPTIEYVIVIYADNAMFVLPTTYEKMLQHMSQNSAVISLATTELDDPKGKGRIVKDSAGDVIAIVEEKDATEKIRQIHEVNAGLYVINRQWLSENIGTITPSPVTQEYYLTDLVAIAYKQGQKVHAVNFGKTDQWFGITTQEDLSKAELIKKRLYDKQ